MTPLAGVIDDKVYEQRLATIDVATNTLTQVTPRMFTSTSMTGRPTARLGSHRRTWFRRRELVRRETLFINSQSGAMREIYAPKWQIAEPRISPDGKSVAFIEGLMSDESSTGGDIYVVPIGWWHGAQPYAENHHFTFFTGLDRARSNYFR